MQPAHDKRMKLQTGVARARMMFKKYLEWLPGFVFKADSDLMPNQSQRATLRADNASNFKWLYIGNDYQVKEKQFTREDLRVAELTIKKLVARFPRALPKIVDDVSHWQARMSSLLAILKTWVHDGKSPELDELLSAGHFKDRWLTQFRALQQAHPELNSLVNAIAFLQLTGKAEPKPDSIRWVADNAFALTLISRSKHFSQQDRLNLQFKFLQLRGEMPAKLLVTICRFIGSEPAFDCPTVNQFTAVNFYSQSIAKLRKRTAEQFTTELASELVPARTENIGAEILAVVDSTLLQKPKRRASLLRMFELFLTPEMISRAVKLRQKLEADEKRLLRILRQLQAGSRLPSKTKNEIEKLNLELMTCEVESKPLRACVAALKHALRCLPSSELKPGNWLQLLPRIPEVFRCQLFQKWQEQIYDSKYKNADLNFFASQLGKLLAKRELPESLKAHWQTSASHRNNHDLVVEACENFAGDRKIHAATIALLSRLVEIADQPIGNESFVSLSSFAAASDNLDYLTSLVVAIGETDQSFWQDELKVAIRFSNSVEHCCQLLSTLHNLDSRWDFIEALKGLAEFSDFPLLKSAIANLILARQISKLHKLQCVLTILKQFNLVGLCLEQSGFTRSQNELALSTSSSKLFLQYPEEFHVALSSLESICTDAASIADSVLGTDFPNQAKLKAQIEPIEARIASNDADPGLRNRLIIRLKNLRRYLDGPEPVSVARLESLQRKLHARVDHEFIQRFLKTGAELASATLKRKFNVGQLIDKLMAPPYETILVEILQLPKQDRKLGLRLLFETEGESTKCFDSEPANIAFIKKLRSLSINCEPWLDSEIWREKTADGTPYKLFFTDSVIDYLLMGFHFRTCLTPGHCNFFSTISNAVDINKKVLYGKTADGKIVGRCLFAINNSGDVLTFGRYQHDDKSGFKEAVGRYLENLTTNMNNEVSAQPDVSSLVSSRWYHDPAEREQAQLFDPASPLVEAFEKAPVKEKIAVLLGSAPRARLMRRFGEYMFFVERVNCDDLTREFIEEFYGERGLSFRDRFRLAVLAFRSAEMPSDSVHYVRRLIGKSNIRSIVSFLQRAYCCEFCEAFRNVGGYEHVYGMLTEYNPTLALRSIRAFRDSKTRSDLDETSKFRRKLLANVHRKLGRVDLAEKLHPAQT